MRGFSRRVPLVLFFALATACARNAAIDIDLSLPPMSTRGFAVVEFARGGDPFGSPWDQSTAFALAADSTPTHFTILTDPVAPVAPLRMRVRFCRYRGCSDPTTHADEGVTIVPSLWYELETPFYRGQRTRWWHDIGCQPTGPATAEERIGRCQIAGCVTVAPTTTPLPPPPVSYCRSDGTHFCEAPTGSPLLDAGPSDSGPDAWLMCSAPASEAGTPRDVGSRGDGASGGDD